MISFNHSDHNGSVWRRGPPTAHGDLWLDYFLWVLQFLRRNSALLICVCLCFYSLSLVFKFLILEDSFFLLVVFVYMHDIIFVVSTYIHYTTYLANMIRTINYYHPRGSPSSFMYYIFILLPSAPPNLRTAELELSCLGTLVRDHTAGTRKSPDPLTPTYEFFSFVPNSICKF